LAEFPIASINHVQPSWWALGFALSGLMPLFAPKEMPSRGLGLKMLFPLIFTESSKIPNGTFKLSMLDVGQGLSTVYKQLIMFWCTIPEQNFHP
jgi:competence protein ComEC